MTQTDLDDLLGRSMPRLENSDIADLAAVNVARAAMGARQWSLGTKVAAVAAATLAALSLSVGTAVAVPLISHWWLWSPEDDVTITTQPFAMEGVGTPATEGQIVVCTVRIRVLSDGKTANLNTVFRLYQARAFLQSVKLADYEDQAQALYANGGDSPRPYEFDHAQMLAWAIESAADHRGLNGQGVSIEGASLCVPQ